MEFVGLLLSASAGTMPERVHMRTKLKLIKGWEVSDTIPQPESSKVAIEWYEVTATNLLEIEDNFEKYRISEALMGTYKLVWDDFVLGSEMIKPAYQQPIDSVTLLCQQ
jgi:valyl-tRNA synthetase